MMPLIKQVTPDNKLRQTGTEIFWGELAPCDHLVEIYADDTAFLDSLAAFVVAGLRADESVIVIACASHRCSLEFRLRASGLDVMTLLRQDLYIPLDAKETLSRFVVDGWPDDDLFEQLVAALLTRARRTGRRVRAFGEMVVLLWAEGHHGATVHLEQLWTQFCHKEMFPVFCAYPRSGFSKDAEASIQEICSAHSKVVATTSPRGVVFCSGRGTGGPPLWPICDRPQPAEASEA
jgi:hypothetical protein